MALGQAAPPVGPRRWNALGHNVRRGDDPIPVGRPQRALPRLVQRVPLKQRHSLLHASPQLKVSRHQRGAREEPALAARPYRVDRLGRELAADLAARRGRLSRSPIRGRARLRLRRSNDRLLVSADRGRSWKELDKPGPLVDLAVDPTNARRIVAASAGGLEEGLYESRDGGES
jgi:hypothetical protein